MNSKLFLITLLFLTNQIGNCFLDYGEVIECKESKLNEINFHWIDAIILVIFSPLALIAISILIISFIKYPQLRKQPGDLILAISISEFILCCHWFAGSIRFLIDTDSPPESGGIFCRINAFFGVFAACSEFLYNCAFSIFLIYKMRNILTKTDIPKFIFHALCLLLSALFIIVMMALDKEVKFLLHFFFLKCINLKTKV